MAPAKGSQTIAKITIKGHEEQHHKDSTSSGKNKLKKRKVSDMIPQWSKDELMCFYEAYRQHGKDWKKVGAVVRSKSVDMIEALYSMHRTFLSLPEREATAVGFIALVTGRPNVVDEFPSHREIDRSIRAPGKAQKRDATLQVDTQKVNEVHCPEQSNSVKSICGLSSSFKKKYYGDLVRQTQRHAVGKRTPRVPILFSGYRNASDNAFENKNNLDSKINETKEITANKNSAVNGYPTEENFGATEANKVPGRIFSETKATGDTDISQSPQHRKKRRYQQSIDEGHGSKINDEIMTVAKEGNKPVDSPNLRERISELFSPDEMMVLDVLQNLVNIPTKMSLPKTNIASGPLGKDKSTSSNKREEGHPPDDQPHLCKQVDECSASKTGKKRKKMLLDKKVLAEEQNLSSNNDLVSLQAHRVDKPEYSSLNSDSERRLMILPEWTPHISTEANLDASMDVKPETTMQRRSKRKSKVQYKTKDACHGNQLLCINEGAYNLLGIKLSHCLSSKLFRRWCSCEWFYSAVDDPWFRNNEFVNYLKFAKLTHLSRLTRSEWSTIRSSLGKPRRFSDHFLAVEKEKLEDYRQKVRTYYALLRNGVEDALPVDLARPFSIGQQVTVRHPSTRELCDGKVLMMGWNCYMIQFDRPDLGAELVKDIDCMPVTCSDYLPEDFQKRSTVVNNMCNKLDIEHLLKLSPKENWDHIMNGISMSEPSKSLCGVFSDLPKVNPHKSDLNDGVIPNNPVNAAKQTLHGQPYEQTQQKEAATTNKANNGFVCVTKKSLLQLDENQENGSLLEHCQDQFARTRLEPEEDVNSVHSVVYRVRLPDKTTSDIHAPWPSLLSVDSTGQSRFDLNYSDRDYELVSYVSAFVQSSISQARQMVDAAMQAISANGIDSQDGEDCVSNQATSTFPKSHASATDNPLPSRLILNCVATVLAIKHLSEARHPPANIAGVLEHAASMLRPSCSENLTIYREIESCISLIKNQMLALVPTSNTGNPATLPI